MSYSTLMQGTWEASESSYYLLPNTTNYLRTALVIVPATMVALQC